MLAAAPRADVSDIIYATGFEAPTFVAGTPLVGQDGWIAPPPLSPNAAVISTAKPRLGRQTVRVQGADLEHQDFINMATNGYYDAIGSFRHPVGPGGAGYDTGGTQTIRVSAQVRVDGPPTATGNDFFSAAIGPIGSDVDGTASSVGQLTISSDGHVYGLSGQDLVPTFLTSAPVTLGEWHELAVVANFATRRYSFFVDGEALSGSFAFDPSAGGNLLRRCSMLTFTAPDTATFHKADYSAHFDRFSIRVVDDDDEQGDAGGDGR